MTQQDQTNADHTRGEIRYREQMKAKAIADHAEATKVFTEHVAALDTELAGLTAKLPAAG